MNPKLLFFLSLILLINPGVKATEPLSLKQAIDQRLVAYRLHGLGGYQGQKLRIELKNLTRKALQIELPAGQVFASEDTNLQDLILTRQEVLALNPGTVGSKNLYTMCTQSGNMAPGSGDRFRMGDMAEGDLYELVQTIALKDYQTSTAQSAVWSIANGDPVRFIFGSDTVMVRELATFVSERRDIPLSEFQLESIPQVITDIRSSLEFLLEDYTQNLSLKLETGEGMVVRTYFENRKLTPGFRQYKVGASYAHREGEAFELFLVLRDGEQILKKKAVRIDESIPEMMRLNAQTALTYEIAKDSEGRIGVYDEKGQLYFLIQDSKPLAKGHHYTRVLADAHLPPGKNYQVKLVSNGQVLAQSSISNGASPPVIYSKAVVNGVFEFELAEPADNLRLILFDQNENQKRIFAEIRHLNPGKRGFRYQFEHRDGPRAQFFIRLVDAKGKVLAEKCATCD